MREFDFVTPLMVDKVLTLVGTAHGYVLKQIRH